MATQAPLAFIIEPDATLAGALDELLSSWGYRVCTFATHCGAMRAAEEETSVALLAACVPTSDDDRDGAYLAATRARQGGELPTVLMLSDTEAADGSEPTDAVPVLKPFGPHEFRAVVQRAVQGNRGMPPRPSDPGGQVLKDRRVLVVQRDRMMAQAVGEALQHAGATLVGPFDRHADALMAALAEPAIDDAVVSIAAHAHLAYQAVDALLERGVRVVLLTEPHVRVAAKYARCAAYPDGISRDELLAALAP